MFASDELEVCDTFLHELVSDELRTSCSKGFCLFSLRGLDDGWLDFLRGEDDRDEASCTEPHEPPLLQCARAWLCSQVVAVISPAVCSSSMKKYRSAMSMMLGREVRGL